MLSCYIHVPKNPNKFSEEIAFFIPGDDLVFKTTDKVCCDLKNENNNAKNYIYETRTPVYLCLFYVLYYV